MTGCSAPKCNNSGAKGFVMLRFPKDDSVREKWTAATSRHNWVASRNNSLCEEHFRLYDWEKYKFKLKPDAVPTVFCDCHPDPGPQDDNSKRRSEHNYSAAEKQTQKRPALGDVSNFHNYCSVQPIRPPTKKKTACHGTNCSVVRNRELIKELLKTKPTDNPLVISNKNNTPPAVEGDSPKPIGEEGFINQLEKENSVLQKKLVSLEKQLAKTKEQRIENVKKRKAEEEEQKKARRFKIPETEGQGISQILKERFSETQIGVAVSGVSRGRTWDEETVKIALKLKCAGGATGLKAASDLSMPLPSARTLRRRISHIKFQPGIQHDVIEDFAQSLKGRPARWKDCLLFFDDMAIKEGRQYDKGSDCYLGGVTLPGVTGVACKGQVHVFGGVAENWQLLGSYHFVPKEAHGEESALVVVQLLEKAKDVGLNCLGLVCDMGNRTVLNALGFRTKKDQIVYCIPNPADPGKPLYCIPDMIHLFKSTKEMLSNNRVIHLPADIVQLYKLPSSRVDVEHIEWLCLYEEDMLVKFDSRLSMDDVHPKHFQKTRVAPATHVLSEKTANSLDFLVATGDARQESSTTAWFLRLMANWKKIMTSRTRKLALSHHNMDEYNAAIALLRLVVYVFRNMSVDGHWKPVQTHIIMATCAVLELQEYLLTKCNYDFVLLGRFLQDLVENLFSLIRAARPTPTAVEFKYRLREIVISKFSSYNSKSSYDRDDRVDALGNLLKRRESVEALPTTTELPHWMDPPETFLTVPERHALYRMSGYVVKSLIDSNQVKCIDCQAALKANTTHEYSGWTAVTNYKEGAQVEVSDEVYRIFRTLEFNLQRWRPIFDAMKSSFTLALEKPLKKIESSLPKCHEVSYKILKKYAVMRLKQFSTESKPSASATSSFGSKSMGASYLANHF